MSTISSILVGFDFSDDSKRALKEACLLAQKFNAKIKVAHIISVDVTESLAEILEGNYHDDISKKLSSDLKAYQDEHEVEIKDEDIHVLQGVPSRTLVRLAEEQNVDLILVGAHQRTAVGRIMLGSVASKIVRYSSVPVMVCRDLPNETFNKIIVPVDGSENAEHALVYAKLLAGTLNAPIQLVYVVDQSSYSHYTEYKLIIEAASKKAEEYLKDLKQRHGITEEAVVLNGAASHELVNYVAGANGGLVVMASHGRTGFSRFLLGSVTESVVNHVPSSVFTLTPDAYKEKVSQMFSEDSKE